MARDTVQEIKDKLTIQDIVSPYVKLTKAGRSLVGLCPFHKEKTPSFHVSLERGSWHCFGCGLGGDGFSFIEKIENVDFKGALKILADKAGVRVEHSHVGRERSERRDRITEAMRRASDWYTGKLSGSAAEAYARKRHLSDETIRAWHLGYAPDAWRGLLEALTADLSAPAGGFTIQELLGAGLIKEADGKPGTYYDRFRNRLMFPIRDAAGRVVAFTGRALSADEQAKYLNSPETELYHKSEILFGMDKAKDAIRTRRFTMLVEGQMDVLLAHQVGFENAVALSGTALSEKHLALMKRASENLMLVLDADAAGLSATAKSAALALSAGMKVKAARLPSGKDPADLISEDIKGFFAYIASAKPIVNFFLAVFAELERDQYRFKLLVQQEIYPLLAAIPSPTERGHFVDEVARYLPGTSVSDIHKSLKDLSKHPDGFGSIRSVRGAPPPARPPHELRSEQLLAVMHVYPNTPLARRIESEYCRITEARSVPSDTLPEFALFQAEQAFGESPKEDAADELLHAFESAVIREAYQSAVEDLRRAEASGNVSSIESAQAVCAKISSRLAAFE